MNIFKGLLKSKTTIFMFAILGFALFLGACSDNTTKTKEVDKEEVTKDEVAKEEATEEATGEQLAFISEFDLSTRSLTIDEVEWIEESDTERIEELELDVEKDLPTGYTIYNAIKQPVDVKLAEDAEFYIVNPESPSEPKSANEKEFISYLMGVAGPYYVTIEEDTIVKVEEKYRP